MFGGVKRERKRDRKVDEKVSSMGGSSGSSGSDFEGSGWRRRWRRWIAREARTLQTPRQILQRTVGRWYRRVSEAASGERMARRVVT